MRSSSSQRYELHDRFAYLFGSIPCHRFDRDDLYKEMGNILNKNQYCIYTSHEDFMDVCTWLKDNDIQREHHLNRTRFWVPQEMMQEFMVGYYYACMRVNDNEDLATGLPKSTYHSIED